MGIGNFSTVNKVVKLDWTETDKLSAFKFDVFAANIIIMKNKLKSYYL